MMSCSRNLSKHFFFFYQTKTNREMFQHDFQFFVNLMNFFLKKKSDQIFPFHICANFQTKKKN